MSTVILLGAKGMLGSSLAPALRAIGHKVITQSRTDGADLCLDPFDKKALTDALIQYCPTAVVNLIAATNVDQCEIQPQIAWRANAGVVATLTDSIASVYKQTKAKPHLVHISTDQVYDGLGPHSEDEVNLINVYGLSKYTGELLASRVGATVLRTNFFGLSRCKGRLSFSDWLVLSFRERTPITVFDDIKFSALHIDTLCSIISHSIERRPAGIFNAGCRDSMSKAEFAFCIAKSLNLPTNQVTVGTSKDLALKARRPLDMSLQVSLLENSLAMRLPSMQDEIEHTVKEYINE